MQVYIVTGGRIHSSRGTFYLDSTETLLKDGGSSWQAAANLPSARANLRGVSLNSGHFIVTGWWALISLSTIHDSSSLQVAWLVTLVGIVRPQLMCWSIIPKQTNGSKLASSARPAPTTQSASCPRKRQTTVSDLDICIIHMYGYTLIWIS